MISLDTILRVKRLLDQAAVHMEHGLRYDPDQDCTICTCGLRWYSEEQVDDLMQGLKEDLNGELRERIP